LFQGSSLAWLSRLFQGGVFANRFQNSRTRFTRSLAFRPGCSRILSNHDCHFGRRAVQNSRSLLWLSHLQLSRLPKLHPPRKQPDTSSGKACWPQQRGVSEGRSSSDCAPKEVVLPCRAGLAAPPVKSCKSDRPRRSALEEGGKDFDQGRTASSMAKRRPFQPGAKSR